jgi:hypothetical protein
MFPGLSWPKSAGSPPTGKSLERLEAPVDPSAWVLLQDEDDPRSHLPIGYSESDEVM